MATLRWMGLVMLATATFAACGTSPQGTSEGGGGGTDDRGEGAEPRTGPPGDGGTASPTAGGNLDHVLSTGQSNSVGFHASPVLSTAQKHANVMFDVGVMTASGCDGDGCTSYDAPKALVPLVEGDRYDAEPVETMSSGFADGVVASAAGASRRVLVSVHGKSGWVYECIRKNGCEYKRTAGYLGAFEEGMRQVEDARKLAAAAGLRHVVRAVTLVHGESDHYTSSLPLDGTDGTPGAIRTYADALVELQRDYETGVRELTGQSEPVPLFVSQMANWNDRTSSEIPGLQLEASERAPGKVILVGPTYMLTYGPDCIHFTNASQRKLGAYFAKAYVQTVLEERPFVPLSPISAEAEGNRVHVRFRVPVEPLVLDTSTIADPGGHGFRIVDGVGTEVLGAEVTAPDTVTLTLSGPITAGAKVTYALDATPGTCPGPETGPRGTLRDSDATSGDDGPLPNFAVAFDLTVR